MRKVLFHKGWQIEQEGITARPITLPHDAMQEQGRAENAPSGRSGAFYKGGIYRYIKTFEVPEDWREQTVLLEFEGIYPGATVYLNGKKIGDLAYGYLGKYFRLDNLKYGEENHLEVFVDDSRQPDSRWYTGAGIYRPIWLWIGGVECLIPESVRVTTESIDQAQIRVDVDYEGNHELMIEILDQGSVVATACGNHSLITVPAAKLWDAEHPYLYECRVTLHQGEAVLDRLDTTFGIRQLSWSSQGLFVNGRSVLLKGGCIHHDNGILGARSYPESEWRRIKRLKEFGFNAVRSAHNPASKAMLEACDALGMYVMDEGWDMWYKPKSKYDYGNVFEQYYAEDIKTIVDKDYNHPSVILYSIGNEVTEPAEEHGVEMSKELVRIFHEEDATRPVTAGINLTLLLMEAMAKMQGSSMDSQMEEGAKQRSVSMNSTVFNDMVTSMGRKMTMAAATDGADRVASPVLDSLDISGYNYASSRYELESKKHPDRIVVGTETYPQDLPDNWRLVEKLPYLIGDFMWTAWDYLGEVGIGSWNWEPDGMSLNKVYPWLLADTGALDILGNDNAEAGIAAVIWGARQTPYIGVVPANHPGLELYKAMWRGTNAIPHWSWQGCEGNVAQVEVYSAGHSVELFLNDVSKGVQELKGCRADFQVAYEPGVLKAVSYDEDGMMLKESSLCSATGDLKIRVLVEDTVAPDVLSDTQALSGEIRYLAIDLVGTNGEIECNRDTCLTVTVEGGELLAFGSARPRSEEDFLKGSYTTYYGRAQAVVRSTDGPVVVKVSGEDLETVEVKVC